MQIFVLNVQGSTINLKVKASDTVDSVIEYLTAYDEKFLCMSDALEADAKLWSEGRFSLHFNSVKLECGRTLLDYNIQKESVLRIKFAGLGGKGKPKKDIDKMVIKKELMLKQKREAMETKTKGRSDLENIKFDPAVIQRMSNACNVLLESLDNSNVIEIITGQLRTLSSDKLQEILDAHNKDKTGGDTTWKLKTSCFIFFGPDGEALLDTVEKLEAVKEGVESAYDLVVSQAF